MATDIRTHTVLLRSDGLAVACGRNDFGQCDIPPLDEGASYTQCFSEVMVMLWLVATKGTESATFHLWRKEPGTPRFQQGRFVQCFSEVMAALLLEAPFHILGASIPPEGISCTQVSVGVEHTVLLQSDGRTVTSGMNLHRQCNIPILDEGLSYTEVSACFCRG